MPRIADRAAVRLVEVPTYYHSTFPPDGFYNSVHPALLSPLPPAYPMASFVHQDTHDGALDIGIPRSITLSPKNSSHRLAAMYVFISHQGVLRLLAELASIFNHSYAIPVRCSTLPHLQNLTYITTTSYQLLRLLCRSMHLWLSFLLSDLSPPLVVVCIGCAVKYITQTW